MQTSIKLLAILAVLAMAASACAPAAAPTVAPAKSTSAPVAATSAPAATKPAAAPATAATAVPSAAPAAKVKRGGTITFAAPTETNTWDPLFTTVENVMVNMPVYETLLRYDLVDEKTGKHEFKGELAESWQIANPTTVVLKLQPGVKFHDGSEWNAEVAKWNFDRARTHPKSFAKSVTSVIKSVDIADPMTIKLTLAEPSATILHSMTRVAGGTGTAWPMMVSKRAVESMGEEAYGRKPVGTGPMKMVEWQMDSLADTRKWEGYWRKGADGQPLPYLDAIKGRIIRDPAVIMMELKAGSVDISHSTAPQDFNAVKANPDLVLQLLPWSASRQVFGFNPQGDTPWAKNVKVRQALQLALDREAMAKALGFGVAEPHYYPLWAADFPGYDQSVPKYGFDLPKAKQLMQEAGQANGFDIALDFQTTTPLADKASEMMQSMWKALNVKAELTGAVTVAFKDKLKAMRFDSATWGMTSSLDPAFYNRGYLCEGAANWNTYCNPELDKCMLEAGRLYDFKERDAVYKKCLTIVYEDAQVGGLYVRPSNLVYRKSVKGLRIQAFTVDMVEAWLDK